MTPPDILSPSHRQMISLAGEVAELFSFNRSLGQLFGFLYMTPQPYSLEEIARSCHMSKGNASLHLRTLEQWGAVQKTFKPGTRKDYYSASTDLKSVILRRLEEGLGKRLGYLETQLAAFKEGHARDSAATGEHADHWNRRLAEMESLIDQAKNAYKFLPKISRLRSFFK